jgi:hypothetical protein
MGKVELVLSGEQKLNVIKVLCDAIPGLGLKEASDFADANFGAGGFIPTIMETFDIAEAEKLKNDLEAVGATVRLQSFPEKEQNRGYERFPEKEQNGGYERYLTELKHTAVDVVMEDLAHLSSKKNLLLQEIEKQKRENRNLSADIDNLTNIYRRKYGEL